MTHATILARLLSLILQSGDNLPGYGFMRVLETLIQIAERYPTNDLISSALPKLREAYAAPSATSGFDVIDIHDSRPDSVLSKELL